MSNPFETPTALTTATIEGGDFDLSQTFRDGWDAMSRNLGVWLVMLLVGGLCTVLSFVACVVPAFVVLPVLSWGSTRFTLDALDGQAELGTLFAGFERIGEVWGPMMVSALLLLAVALPGFAVSMVGQIGTFFLDGQDDLGLQMVMLGVTVLGSFLNRAWDVVVLSRFLPAMFLVVDKGMAPLDAFTESWRLTSTCWGKSMVFYLAAIFLPVVGMLACCVGIIPATLLAIAAQGAMYRQLVGRAAA